MSKPKAPAQGNRAGASTLEEDYQPVATVVLQ